MRLFVFNRDNYEVEVEPEALMLAPFNALYKKDKTKSKDKFMKQMAFIWFMHDTKSDYAYITDPVEKAQEIQIDLDMIKRGSETLYTSKELEEAEEFYKSFRTITEELYVGASTAASVVIKQLKDAEGLLKQVEPRTGKPLYTLKDINGVIQQIPKIMRDLKLALKEVILEQKDNEGKSTGSKDFNLFEDGFKA